MSAPHKLQGLILGTVILLALIYSQDKISGIAHDSSSPGFYRELLWVAEKKNALLSSPAQTTIVGNSMAGYAFDESLYSRLSGKPTAILWKKGTASAWYYLLLKNLILPNKPPETVVVIFRDNILTRPELRVWGTYKGYLDALAGPDTSLLDELAYLNHKNTAYYLSNYFPFFADRRIWRDLPKFKIQALISKHLLGIGTDELGASFYQVFTENGIRFPNVGDKTYYNSTILNADRLRFEENLSASFLPHIVELCRQNGINLVAVRIQRLVDQQKLRDTDLVDQYIRQFSRYAKREGFYFIDFTGKPWLKREHYSTNDHLTAVGKKQFTQVLYREIKRLMLTVPSISH